MKQYGTKEWFEWMFESGKEGEDRWGHQWRISQRIKYNVALSLIQPIFKNEKRRLVIADFCCGLGDFLRLVHTVDSRHWYLGFDIAENAIRYAERWNGVAQYQVNALPRVPNILVDVAIVLDCINYLPHDQREAALRALFSILHPGGYILFSSPLGNPNKYFSAEQALRLVQQAGFKIVTESYNYTKLVSKAEKIWVAASANLVGESDDNDGNNTNLWKVMFKKSMQIPFLRSIFYILRKVVVSYPFMLPLYAVDKLQNRKSHIIILASKPR